MLEDLKEKATEILGNDTVKEVVDKATDFIKTEKGQEIVETIKEKAEEFIGGIGGKK